MSATQERSNNPQRRQRSRGGRNRGGNRSDRGRRNDRRSRNGGRRRDDTWRNPAGRGKKPAKPTLGQKIVSILTFGLVSPTRKSAAKPSGARRNSGSQGTGDAQQKKSATQARPPKKSENRRAAKSSRTPELLEVTSGRLYVGNLSYDASESDLMDLFKGVGQVQSAEVVSHKRTMRSKGYAFVQMLSLEEAKRAVEVLHDEEFMGRKLVVSGAKTERPDNVGESNSSA